MMRDHFDQQLNELRNNVVMMGSKVGEALTLAMQAYEEINPVLADAVIALDQGINEWRFRIEDDCVALIVMQQPAARDVRTILAALHMTVDLERIGDQAKGIAKTIPYIQRDPSVVQPEAVRAMALLVGEMLTVAIKAYADEDVELAESVGPMDHRVDEIYGEIFQMQMGRITESDRVGPTEAAYEVLRLARDLERCGDLATNLAERVVYAATGDISEMNVDTQAAEA